VQHRQGKVVSMRRKKEVDSLISAERKNLIAVVTCMSDSETYVPPLTAFPRKKYERTYGWSTGGLNCGLPSKLLDSDGYI